MNFAFITGNIGSEIELKHVGDGTPMCQISVASQESKKVNGEWENYPEWHKVVAWGNTAQGLQKFCKKGDRITVQGSLKTDSYEDKNGNKVYTTKIVARSIEFPPKKKSDSDARPSSPSGDGLDLRSVF
jgi:single-strand DNA-binding protein